MSIRDRYSIAAPWIVLAIGLALVATLSGSYFYSKGYQRANDDHQTEDEADRAADRAYSKCSTIPSVEEALRCYQEAYQANADQRRADQDLNAQREMADWAEGMLWATGLIGALTVGVTGLGVWWVRETLIATREAVRAADDAVIETKRIGEAQVRAYLTCTGGTFAVDRIWAQAWLTVINKGQSPAFNVKVKAGWSVMVPNMKGSLGWSRRDGERTDGSAEIIAAGASGRVFMLWSHTQVGTETHDAIRANITTFHIDGVLSWTDIFDQEHSIVFTVQEPAADGPLVPMQIGDKFDREGKLEAYNRSAHSGRR